MPGYTEEEARVAVAASRSYAETLRRLGLRSAGDNAKLLRRWLERWQISTDHFDRHVGLRERWAQLIPLEDILVPGSSYSRGISSAVSTGLGSRGPSVRCAARARSGTAGR
jgi:hypothetical protein